MSTLRTEFRRLAELSIPVAGAQLGGMLMGVVDTVMVGRVGVEALAAASIANAWIFALLLFGQGLVQGIDPLVTQAHGAGDGRRAGLAAQRGAVLAILVSLPLAVLFWLTEPALLALGQSPELTAAAHRYTVVQIGSIPCYLLFIALRQFLQGREIVRPTLWVTLVANVFNAVANYALIFGELGLPALGLLGAGIATALTRLFMLLLLLVWVARFRLQGEAPAVWGREAFDGPELRRVLALGFPVAVQMSLEIFAFSTATLIAGRLGAVALAAHTIVLNMASLSFMVPLGISQGAVTRVGNLIGAGEPQVAQRAAGVALVLGGSVMTVSATSFVLLRHWLPAIYTADPAVVALAASILPIAAAFQIFDGVQVVGGGVLRGMGRTRPAAAFNLIGYWLLGLPVGGWLALRTNWQLAGLWWGLCLGLAVVAGSLLIWLRIRGPGRVATRAD